MLKLKFILHNNVYTKSLAVSLVLFYGQNICAQISSTLKDTNDETVPGATIIMQKPDSTFVDAVISDEFGRFVINQNVQSFRLVIKHLSYKTVQLVLVSDEVPPLIVLEDNQKSLGDVVVNAYRPVVTHNENGGMTYNAELISLNRPVTNALELLEEVPGIIKEGDNYSMVGAGKTSIIINGRKSIMGLDEVKRILAVTDVSQVKYVEVNYTSQEQYGVRGASINVVLEKKRSQHLKTSGDVHYTGYSGRKYYQMEGVHLNVTHQRWSYELSCAAATTDKQNRGGSEYTHNVAGQTHSIAEHLTYTSDLFGQRIINRFSFDLKNGGLFSALYDIKHTDRKVTSESPLTIDNEDISQNNSVIKGDEYLHISNIEYSHNKFKVGVDYVFFDYESKQDLKVESATRYRNMLSDDIQKIYKASFYLNNSLPLGRGALLYGLTMDYSNAKSKYNNEWKTRGAVIDYSHSDQLEKNTEVYAKWTEKFGDKATLSAGLTMQYYYAHMKDEQSSYTLWREFFFFPTINLRYNITPKRSYMFELSTNRDYPRYFDTNGMKRYNNVYKASAGNPNLQPETSYVCHLTHDWNKRYIAGAYFSYIKNESIIFDYMSPDTLQSTISKYNADNVKVIGVTGVVPIFRNKVFNSQLSMDVSYRRGKCEVNELDLRLSTMGGKFSLSNNYILNNAKTLTLQLSGIYNMPHDNFAAHYIGCWYATGALTWHPKKSGLSVVLRGTDLFNTYSNKYKMHYNSNTINAFVSSDIRQAVLNVRYVFNSFVEKKGRVVDTSRMAYNDEKGEW